MMSSVLLYFFGDIDVRTCDEILTAAGSARLAGPTQLSYEFNTTNVEIDLDEGSVAIYSVLSAEESVTLSLQDFIAACRLFKMSIEEFYNLAREQFFRVVHPLGFTVWRFVRTGAVTFRATYEQESLGIVLEYDFSEQIVRAYIALLGLTGDPIDYEEISAGRLAASEGFDLEGLAQAHHLLSQHTTTTADTTAEEILSNIRLQVEYYESLFREYGHLILNRARERFHLPSIDVPQ